MGDLYNTIMSLCKSKGISGYRLCKDLGLQPSVLTDLKMGRQSGVSAQNAEKIASYFGVSVGYLLGKNMEKPPAPVDERPVKEEDIKIALFGGDGEVTDEMWEEAKIMAEIIKEKYRRKKE